MRQYKGVAAPLYLHRCRTTYTTDFVRTARLVYPFPSFRAREKFFVARCKPRSILSSPCRVGFNVLHGIFVLTTKKELTSYENLIQSNPLCPCARIFPSAQSYLVCRRDCHESYPSASKVHQRQGTAGPSAGSEKGLCHQNPRIT